MVLRPLLGLACATALAFAAAPASAQESAPLTDQPAAFSVLLDLNALSKPGAVKPALPIWFESFQTEPVQAQNGAAAKTIYRLRLRRMPSLHHELLLRIFFDDMPDMSPVVTAWTESGKEQFRSPALGIGIGLPTSESVMLPLDGADYIDVEVPGDGSTIRSVFASSLKDVLSRQTIDFQPAAEMADPFGNLPAAHPADEDTKLFGRVKATVDTGTVQLSPKAGVSSEWQFELAGQPLTAVVSFEVLNADLNAPPVVVANDGPPGFANIQWPDLADPGFRGESRPLEPSMRFQYTGWVRAQFVIPGHLLHSGLNQIKISLSEDSGPIAVRNVELQLKYNWKQFDYILTPAHR